MAGYIIHLAVGKRYLDKYNIENKFQFLEGVLAPDKDKNKIKSHYSKTTDKRNLVKYLEGKVDLNAFLNNNNIDSDYSKGVFLHLVTDYFFFNNFFEKEKLKKEKHSEFIEKLHISYDLTNEYLMKKYDVKYNDVELLKYKECLIDLNKIEVFIEEVTNKNLEDYKKEIINKTS